jgi:hypothetical protein
LDTQQCGPKPEPRLYEIYVTKLILDFIIEGVSVDTAADYALDFVGERALELGKEGDWQDLWGDRGRRAK